LLQETKSELAATSSWLWQGGGGEVPAMAAMGEVDRVTPVDRARGRMVARTRGVVRQGEGRCVRGDRRAAAGAR
jgi:hypothetical protein